MEIKDLFKKENIYKIAALFFVLLFLFEYQAFSKKPQKIDNYSVSFSKILNATLAYYEPYILVNKKPTNLTYIKNIEEKNGTYLIIVDKTENLPKLYINLLRQNIKGKTNAIIQIPSIKEKNISSDPSSITISIYPVYDLKSKIPIKISGSITNKKLFIKDIEPLPIKMELNGTAKITEYNNKTNQSKVIVKIMNKTFLSKIYLKGEKNQIINISANVYIYSDIVSLINISKIR